MRKPSYGCARAGAGAFKPSAPHARLLGHTQTQIKTQRKHIYKEDTNSFPCVASTAAPDELALAM